MAIHSSILAWRMPMERGAWWATVYGVAKSQTQLSMHAICMFQRCFRKISHPLLLPLCPKVCLYVYVSLAALHIRSSALSS